MRKIILMLALAVLLTACGKDRMEEQAETTASAPPETAAKTTAPATSVETQEVPAVFTMDAARSVEDYYGGDVLYKADFDGDGEKENCTVKIVCHGTQCYVEEIEITRTSGEKIVVEHPTTATGMRSNLYKSKACYNIYLHAGPEGYTDGVIISGSPGGGSGELGLAVQAKKGEHDVVLQYLFYADRLAAPVAVWEN